VELGTQPNPCGGSPQELDQVTVCPAVPLLDVGRQGIGAHPDGRIGREPGSLFVAEIQGCLHAAIGHRGQPALTNGDVLLGGHGSQSLVDQRDQGGPRLARDHRLLVLAEGGGTGHLEVDDAIGLHQVVGDDQVADIGVGASARHGQQRLPGALLDGQDDGGLRCLQEPLHDIAALDGHCPSTQVDQVVDVPRVLAGEDRPGGREIVLAHGQCGQTCVGPFGRRQQIIVAVRPGHVREPLGPGVRGGNESEIDVEQLGDDPQVVHRHACGLGTVDLPGRVIADADADGVFLLQPGKLIRTKLDRRALLHAPLAQNLHHDHRVDGLQRLVDDAEQRGVLLEDRIAQVDLAAGDRKRQVRVRQEWHCIKRR